MMNSSEYKYTVIDNTNLDMLVERINELMGQGWEPLGGIATASIGGLVYYFQTMIRATQL